MFAFYLFRLDSPASTKPIELRKNNDSSLFPKNKMILSFLFVYFVRFCSASFRFFRLLFFCCSFFFSSLSSWVVPFKFVSFSLSFSKNQHSNMYESIIGIYTAWAHLKHAHAYKIGCTDWLWWWNDHRSVGYTYAHAHSHTQAHLYLVSRRYKNNFKNARSIQWDNSLFFLLGLMQTMMMLPIAFVFWMYHPKKECRLYLYRNETAYRWQRIVVLMIVGKFCLQ